MKRLLHRGFSVFALAAVLFIAVEAASRVVYRTQFGTGYSAAAIRAKLEQSQATAPASAEGTVPKPYYIQNKRLHPYLGFVLKRDDTVLNSFGFDGPAPPLDSGADHSRTEYRVAVVGGSVAKNFAAEIQQRPGSIFAELSRALAPRKLVFYSLAIDGYKQPQQLTTVAYFLSLGASFDLVVNIDGFNELVLSLTENLPAKSPLSFPRQWRIYSASGFDAEASTRAARIWGLRDLQDRLRQELSGSIFRYSAFGLTLWEGLNRRIENSIETETARAQRQWKDDSPAPQAEPLPDDLEAAASASIRLWSEGSRQLRKLCEANGILYLHVLQPNQYFHGAKESFSEEELRIAFAPPSHKFRSTMERYSPLLQSAGAELRKGGEIFVDLSTIFAKVRESTFSDDCCHLNRRGNEIAGDRIAAEAVKLLRK